MKLKLLSLIFSIIAVMSLSFAGTYTHTYCDGIKQVSDVNVISSSYSTQDSYVNTHTNIYTNYETCTSQCIKQSTSTYKTVEGFNDCNKVVSSFGVISNKAESGINNVERTQLNINLNSRFRNDFIPSPCEN